jgi:ATP-dependent DNA ligase
MRRRGRFSFVAFDLLGVNGRDIRDLPLLGRKTLLRAIVPKREFCPLVTARIRRR